MPATVTVLYPKDTKFDMDYYLATHMPLVQKKWGPHGLTSWKVLEFGKDDPYCVQATLEFETMQKFHAAAGSAEAKEVFDDVPKFSDKGPTLMAGEVKATA